MLKLFLTFFYIGLIRPAPGTWGSVAGAVVGVVVLYFFSNTTLFLATILLTLVSINAINIYEEKVKKHDSSEIVIDEVAGVWLALCICGENLAQAILALVLFRVFDISKPSIIGRVDKNVKGGLGVMGDDLLAGFIAGIMGLMLYHTAIKFGLDLNSFFKL